MNRYRVLPLLLLIVLIMGQPSLVSRASTKIIITWAVGLGTGTSEEQIDVQNRVVRKFNLSQDQIELRLDVMGGSTPGPEVLWQLINAGSTPDIVGPVGFSGANQFEGKWLDLQPLVDKSGYDLSQFPLNVVNLHRESAGLMGIPFSVFPGLLYYNAELFDAAGLGYPPAAYGEKYLLDGELRDWDYDTLALVAKRLTRDEKGTDPDDPQFDPQRIVQFGFVHQWDNIRSDFSTFGGAYVVNEAGQVVFPDGWRAQAQWLWDGLWRDHFIPDASYQNTDRVTYNPFASGKVAMARSMLWYTCCLADLKARWDLAAAPTYKGQVYAPADADTFRILKTTEYPDAAFAVLRFLMDEGADDLLKTYGGFPARPEKYPPYLKQLAEQFPHVQNWSIAPASLEFAVAPGQESAYPHFDQGQKRFEEFRTLIYSDTGKDINLNQELDKLQADLEKIADVKPPSSFKWTPQVQLFNGVEMVLVPSGCFDMGTEQPFESPPHEQCFESGFWIDKTEVTQAQFKHFEGQAKTPSYFTGDNHPVESILWAEAFKFCELRGARLPTEAEWEYAARGPDELQYPWGNDFMPAYVVYARNSNGRTAAAGSKPQGASWVGALDMAGNVKEWTNSILDEQKLPYPYRKDDGREAYDPAAFHVLRGGAWDDGVYQVRSAPRNLYSSGTWNRNGFRCARSD